MVDVHLRPIGWTGGYGHFHVSDDLFVRLRAYLERVGHSYANGHQFGDGPNWRMRVIRVGLHELELDPMLLRHGIERQVFAMPLADNFREYLTGKAVNPSLRLLPAHEISREAVRRWVKPRALRCPEYAHFEVEQLKHLLLAPGS